MTIEHHDNYFLDFAAPIYNKLSRQHGPWPQTDPGGVPVYSGIYRLLNDLWNAYLLPEDIEQSSNDDYDEDQNADCCDSS